MILLVSFSSVVYFTHSITISLLQSTLQSTVSSTQEKSCCLQIRSCGHDKRPDQAIRCQSDIALRLVSEYNEFYLEGEDVSFMLPLAINSRFLGFLLSILKFLKVDGKKVQVAVTLKPPAYFRSVLNENKLIFYFL